ncbi:MAG: o-succinylbenzoate synthase [Chlorobiaceae bacterium]|nr:o-succinylbenzoate synthase [Chlorobiaceae bacterium]
MNASHLFLYRYTIPLTEEVNIRGHRINGREGIVLALQCSDGKGKAFGEIAPLPGLHDECLDMAEAQLIDCISSRTLTAGDELPGALYPSVRTGLEMAMINLAATASGTPPSFFPETESSEQLPLNALLFGNAPAVLKRAETLFSIGYRTFKLKVDAKSAANAIECIRALYGKYENGIELRLDANQTFTLDEAVDFAARIPEGAVSYIEEPLRDAAAIGEFHARSAMLSALDETLWQHPGLAESLPVEALKAMVLKPNRLGGIDAVIRLMRKAEKAGLQTVLSSAFESGISLGMYAWLAASASAKPPACGLDTFRYLKHDLLETPFGTSDSVIDARKAFTEGQKVDLHALNLLSIWTL